MSNSTSHERLVALELAMKRMRPDQLRVGLPSLMDESGNSWLLPLQQIGIEMLGLLRGLTAYRSGGWSGDRPTHIIAHELMQRGKSLNALIPEDVAPYELDFQHILPALEAAVRAGDVEVLLRMARTLCCETRQILGDLPCLWPTPDEAGQARYGAALARLDAARKSPSQAEKKAYLDYISAQLMPGLWADIAYFQSISFFISYVHLDFACKIPFTPNTFMLLSPTHRPVLLATKHLQLKTTLMQTGGPHAGIRLRLWEGVTAAGKPTGFYCTDSVGTNSDGPDRDAVMKRLGISTGALANPDPRGISFTAFEDLKPQITEILRGLPPNAVVMNIGHSLGATVATRMYLLLKELGHESVYLMGFNGGAFNDPVDLGTRHAARNQVMLVQNRRDPVPYGGRHLLPGNLLCVSSPMGGTIATSNPSSDVINHGQPGYVAAFSFGVPARYTLRMTQELERGIPRVLDGMITSYLPWLKYKLLTSILRPDASEAAKTDLTFIRKDFSGK